MPPSLGAFNDFVSQMIHLLKGSTATTASRFHAILWVSAESMGNMSDSYSHEHVGVRGGGAGGDCGLCQLTHHRERARRWSCG